MIDREDSVIRRKRERRDEKPEKRRVGGADLARRRVEGIARVINDSGKTQKHTDYVTYKLRYWSPRRENTPYNWMAARFLLLNLSEPDFERVLGHGPGWADVAL